MPQESPSAEFQTSKEINAFAASYAESTARSLCCQNSWKPYLAAIISYKKPLRLKEVSLRFWFYPRILIDLHRDQTKGDSFRVKQRSKRRGTTPNFLI